MTQHTEKALDQLQLTEGKATENLATETIMKNATSLTSTTDKTWTATSAGRTIHADDILMRSLCNADEHTTGNIDRSRIIIKAVK